MSKLNWDVIALKGNLLLGQEVVEAHSKYEAKQIAKRLYPTATEFKVKVSGLDGYTGGGVRCPYCGKDTEFINSKSVYHKDHGMIYLCRKCDAYVGVHEGTNTPLGTPANKELRELRKKAHSKFDPIWKNKHMTRTYAYCWLATRLGLHISQTHIGMFDVNKCEKTIKICDEFWRDLE